MTGEAADDNTGKRAARAAETIAYLKKPPTQLQQTTVHDVDGAGSPDVPPASAVPAASGGTDAPAAVGADGAIQESRYAVGQLHAEGGIGRVWLARDTQLNRDVAIKTLRPELIHHGRVRDRFLQEAQITGQLEHPGIVPVYELVADPKSGSPFYAMRFVHGTTLAEAAQQYHKTRKAKHEDPLGLVALLSAFVTVCNTVAYAHSQGVIHRDLKGENVLLGSFGEVIVLDWGIAKVIGAPEESSSEQPPIRNLTTDTSHTLQGDIVGTPAYMAPEQAEGRLDRIDHRTDIYGLGAILYEILTGLAPFVGTNTVDVLAKVMHADPIPPHDLWPDVPPALEAACLRALSKEPADRHDSAAALGLEIQTWQEVERRKAEEEVRRSRERFELAVRGSQDGLWDWCLQTNEVFFSPRWKSIIGYEDHEIGSRLEEWESRLHPDERERVLADNYAHINGTTDHYESEYRMRHKDGSYRWILARGVALRDASGKAYRMAGSHVDITARKEMEQRLRETEQRYRAVVDSAPCGILAIDADGNLHKCNAQAKRMLGISADRPAHGSFVKICKRAVNDDGSAVDDRQIHELLHTETGQQPSRLILQFRDDNGTLRRISLLPCPVAPQNATDQSGMVIFLQES